jgi:hypothetical protein
MRGRLCAFLLCLGVFIVAVGCGGGSDTVVDRTQTPPSLVITGITGNTIDFGSTTIHTTVSRTFHATAQAGSFQITSATISPADYSIAGNPTFPITINAGQTLDVTINFTPTVVGPDNGTLQFVSSDAPGTPHNVTLTGTGTSGIAPLQIITTTVANGQVGVAYSATVSAQGGTTPYSWTVTTPATFPPGLAFTSGGVITGTPTAAGTFTFTVQVADAGALTATQALTLTIAPAPLAITTTSLPDAPTGAPYAATLQATGGTAPYTWSVADATKLPPGITVDSVGNVAGTPTTTGSFTFTVIVTDSALQTTSQSLTINVVPVLAIQTPRIWGGIEGVAYNTQITTVNGVAPVTLTLASGTLPPGITLAANGTLAGTPTTPGFFNFTVQAVDSASGTASQSFSIVISPATASVGNTGNAYADEGGAVDPSAIAVSACGTLAGGGKSYKLTGNIGTDPTANCLVVSGHLKLDLAGFTITGRVVMHDINWSGGTMFNGTVNCTWPDNGGSDVGCINLTSTGDVTASSRFHHLTIFNNGVNGVLGSRGMHMDWASKNRLVSGPSVRVYNISGTVSGEPAVGRSSNLSLVGANLIIEAFNNDLTCASDANACQALICLGEFDCKMHHNHFDMQQLGVGVLEQSRAMLFDGDTKGGEAWNNDVNTANNRGVRIRDSAHIRVHDNVFHNITTPNIAAIHLGDPDNPGSNADDLDVLIDFNTFEANGGIIIMDRSGFNAFVQNNTVTCSTNCNSLFAFARTGLKTVLDLNSNPTASLLTAPQTKLESGTTVNICKSGTAAEIVAGTATISISTSCP